jgi:hypothetical protein
VKKLVFIILSLQIITSGNFLGELVKFNSLIEHFVEHEKGSNPLTMMQFLKLHYFNPQHESSDPKRHASLPLHQSNISFTVVYNSPADPIQLAPFSEIFSKDFTPINKGLTPQHKQVSVFQPPRVI